MTAHQPRFGRPLSRRSVLAGLSLAALSGAAAACAPGSTSAPARSAAGPISTDIAGLGPITLTVWDQNTEGGIKDAQEKLNVQFQQKYPNVTIQRVAQSFSDLKTTLKLALSGDSAPDVVQANQGYPDMGAFVQAGLLQPADPWDGAYGWTRRFPSDLLALNRFTGDGKTWRKGDLYGISQTGEIVGLYYNKQLLAGLGLTAPTSMDELVAMLPRVKAAGQLPLQYGNSDKTPGIHIYGALISAIFGSDAATKLVSGEGGAWTDPGPTQAATTLAEWGRAGYLTDGANGVSKTAAVEAFGKGQGVFHFDGTWRQAELEQAMGDNVGFVALSGIGKKPETLGGVGLAWALTSKTKNANAGAAYIEFVTNAAASQVLVDTGNLPVVLPDTATAKPGTLAGDIAASWKDVSQHGGLVPYLDYATPTFYDTITAAVQQLTAGQYTPTQFTEALQKDADAFKKTQ
jgi:raffinose/stachyose/melibiose transport system substrate-binding protein